MSLPQWLRDLLPADTAAQWERIRRVVPPSALMVGGTALTVHLRHRVSRDLDFFVLEPFDTGQLADELARSGRFAVTTHSEHTLNGVLGRTKVQFLDASDQRFVESPIEVAGIRVAGLGDILATKLKVIQDRGEHRDYFDLKSIEQRTGRTVEEGLRLFTQHYQLREPDRAVVEIVRGLGFHDDLEEDPGVPEPLTRTTSYWQARLPALVAAADRTGTVARRHSPTGSPPRATTPREDHPTGPIYVDGYVRADGTVVRGYIRRR